MRQAREDKLRSMAALYRGEPLHNLAERAMDLTTKRSMADLLLELSADPLPEAERAFLTAMLYHIAIGDGVREALGIEPRRIGHRPLDPMAKWIAEEIQQRIDEGDEEPDAIGDVARVVGRDGKAVREAFRRWRGRRHER